jgi:S1-C subfamily serine protease
VREFANLIRPNIVRIEIPRKQNGDVGIAVGSGFLVSNNGHVLTCWHCVTEFSTDRNGYLQYEYPEHIFVIWNDRQYNASVVHRQTTDFPYTTDFAILKIEVSNTPFLDLGAYGDIRQGDEICFMGYPFGYAEVYFGTGHIASLHSRPSDQNRLVRYDVMELDASVNRGNSGGPLWHIPSRKVVGIVALRHGTITPNLEVLRNYFKLWPGSGGILETGMVELIDLAERFTNVGLGTAVSVEYAKNELKATGVLQ